LIKTWCLSERKRKNAPHEEQSRLRDNAISFSPIGYTLRIEQIERQLRNAAASSNRGRIARNVLIWTARH
jgi:hypothetical protein